MKFIKALSEVEVLSLRAAQRDGPTPRMRQRALAVLLSSQGLRITQLVAVLGVDRVRFRCGWTLGRRAVFGACTMGRARGVRHG